MSVGNTKCQANTKDHYSVSCGYDCDHCGFNPEEATRRMKEGYFEVIAKSHTLFNDNGDEVSTIVNTCRKLVFPPANS